MQHIRPQQQQHFLHTEVQIKHEDIYPRGSLALAGSMQKKVEVIKQGRDPNVNIAVIVGKKKSTQY